MDGLGAAANVTVVIQISGQIFDLCRKYYMEVKDARKDIQRLRNEVTSLQDVLINIADLSDAPGSASPSALASLNQFNGTVQLCETELRELFSILDAGQGKDKMRQFGLRALRWPLSSEAVDRALQTIERHKATFNLALNADQRPLVLAIKQSVIDIEQGVADIGHGVTDIEHGVTQLRQQFATHRTDECREKITQWLSMFDPSSNHNSACMKHQPTTGEWFINSTNFEEWKQTRNSLIWLYGIPGCGKTILSSTIIEHLKGKCNPKTGFALAYFYFDFNDSVMQEVSVFVSSLIVQLCNQIIDLPAELKELYQKCNNGQQKATTDELKGTLSRMMKYFENIFIVIDALDEYSKSGEREELFEFIRELKSWSSSNLHLLVTSRQEPDIGEALSSLLTSPAIPIEGSHVGSDIKLHISHQLATDPKLSVWPKDVKGEIEDTLVKGANGMFRWVSCQLDALKKCLKVTAIRKALKNLPKTLNDTYARILINIEEDYQQEALTALLWLAFSQRPLRIAEVAEAIVINRQSDPPFDPIERLPDPCNVLHILGSLVTISKNEENNLSCGMRPEATEEIRLAHYSVKEYLLSDRIRSGPAQKFSVSDIFANHLIAECSLLYINYAASNAAPGYEEVLEYFPLLEYACQFWHRHAYSIPVESQRLLDPVILKLLRSDATFLSWLLRLHLPYEQRRFNDWDDTRIPLYYASDVGLVTVVRRLLEEGADIQEESHNGATYVGGTPLHRAAVRGHDAVVKLLLERGADVSAMDHFLRTPLHRAASKGHESVVRILLEKGANVDAKNQLKDTPLHQAASKGHESVVRLLLEEGADVCSRDNQGRTPLESAAVCKHEKTAMLLIDKGADIDAKDHHGRTVLHWAAYNEQDSLLNKLLKKMVDINLRDSEGKTALHFAARNGNWPTVQQLLINGAEPEVKEYQSGLTALHWAARRGYAEMARLLLQSGATVDARDIHGETPLSMAARFGQRETARVLLNNGADVDSKNNQGMTPLYQAAAGGYEEVLRLLLDTGAHVDKKTRIGLTALHRAAWNGHEMVVQRLLENGADVNAKDNNGRTAVYIAAVGGCDMVEKLLLENGAAESRSIDPGSSEEQHVSRKLLLGEMSFGWRYSPRIKANDPEPYSV